MNAPEPGQSITLEDGLRHVLAPNPGPMTHWGTNTFVIGEGEVAVIDPGPDIADHFEAILKATRGETISHILITHAHLDHSPLARRLALSSGAAVHGFGPPDAGRRPIMTALVEAGLAGGGEGVDTAFAPDITLADGDVVESSGWRLGVHHTPGHFAGHLSFSLGQSLISGDHVMDWSSSLVSPPDGDIVAFMETTRRLSDAPFKAFHPAHGGRIDDPTGRLQWLLHHRLRREAQILEVLGSTPINLAEIARRIYCEIAREMLPVAERNVFSHLIDLHERNLVDATPFLSFEARFHLT